jgi:hypothetical protein
MYEGHPLCMLPPPLNLIPALLALLGLALEPKKILYTMISSLSNKNRNVETEDRIIELGPEAPIYIILPVTGSNIILR